MPNFNSRLFDAECSPFADLWTVVRFALVFFKGFIF
jgi:hypothetical protein